MSWKKASLSQPGPEGYGATSRPIEDLLADAVARLGQGRMPAVVWIHDRLDERKELAVQKVLADEGLCLALRRFLCLKADVQTVPHAETRELLAARAPMLLFYDPGGERFDVLSGRRATSRSAISTRVAKLWHLSYDLGLREYTRRMDDIFDRLERIEREKRALEDKMIRAEDKPEKLGRLVREEAKLEKAEAGVLEDEKEVLRACRIRERYREPDRSDD